MIELYRSQLALAHEEKGMLLVQVKALTEEIALLHSSIQDTTRQMDELLSEIKFLHETLDAKDNRIADLEQQLRITSIMLNLKILSRIKNFVIGCFTVDIVIICGK